jgi:hypothetical protein
MEKREISDINRIILHNSGCLDNFHFSISLKGELFKSNDIDFAIDDKRGIEIVIEGQEKPNSAQCTSML